LPRSPWTVCSGRACVMPTATGGAGRNLTYGSLYC
jgi:hypothetical protein